MKMPDNSIKCWIVTYSDKYGYDYPSIFATYAAAKRAYNEFLGEVFTDSSREVTIISLIVCELSYRDGGMVQRGHTTLFSCKFTAKIQSNYYNTEWTVNTSTEE